MTYPKKARYTSQEAAEEARTHRETSRRWLLECFAPRSSSNRDSKTCGWEMSTGTSSTEDSQPAASPRQINLEPNAAELALESTQKLWKQSTSPRRPCQQPIWSAEKRREPQVAGVDVQTEKSASSDTNLALQLHSDAEKRLLLAPYSFISPIICQQHPEYNLENTDPVPPQWCQNAQCYEPISNSSYSQQADSGFSASESNNYESTQSPVNCLASVRKPCRQTIWRRKKREEAKTESRLRTRPEPGVLQTQDHNPAQQHSGQGIDLGAAEPALAAEKWPRGPVVKNVGLRNKVLDTGAGTPGRQVWCWGWIYFTSLTDEC